MSQVTQSAAKDAPEKPIAIGIDNPQQIRLIRLNQRRGSLFPGEIGGWPDPIAQRMLEEKVGIEVDENGDPIEVPNELSVAPISPQPQTIADSYKFDEKTDPFITDGISKTAALALHKRGLHTPQAVRQFIVDGGNVNDIERIGDAQAEKINKLYGQADDESDD